VISTADSISEVSKLADRTVLTIATSKKTYVDMACNLAMSFLLWNDITDVNFLLVTDCPQFIPEKIQQKIRVITVSRGELGDGFSSKLQMDQFACTEQTLFIDADCLIYGSLLPAFDTFRGKQVSAVGYNRYKGNDIGFCRDIANVIEVTGISYFPLICGSVYYFEKGDIAKGVFEHARKLLKSYNDIGLVTLRGKENEEPLLAISMAKFNQEIVADTGSIKADRMFYEHLESNVLTGRARLRSIGKPPVPEYSTLKSAEPLIVHFNASHAETFEYGSETIRLHKFFLQNWPLVFVNSYAVILFVLPGRLRDSLKKAFRPLYNSIFGHRKVALSKRM
jgi:hypothetical protein